MDNVKSIYILLSFIHDLLKYDKFLTEDFSNNYKICHELCTKILNETNAKLLVEGIKNIPSTGSILITPNHISFFDIILLLSIIDRPISFAAAKELYSYPLLNEYIRSLNCVSIDRNTSDYREMKQQLSNINNAIKENGLIVFPEGECSYNQEINEFKKGAFMNLFKSNTLIVPTYISTPSIIKIGKWTIPKDSISVVFGTPFKVENEFDRKPKSEDIAELTRLKVLELKKKAEQ